MPLTKEERKYNLIGQRSPTASAILLDTLKNVPINRNVF